MDDRSRIDRAQIERTFPCKSQRTSAVPGQVEKTMAVPVVYNTVELDIYFATCYFGQPFETLLEVQSLFWCSKNDRNWVPFWKVAYGTMIIVVFEKWSNNVEKHAFGHHFETMFEVQWLFWCSKNDRQNVRQYAFGHRFEMLHDVQWLFWCSKNYRNMWKHTILDTILKHCMICNGYFGARIVIKKVRAAFFLTPFWNVAWGAMVILVLEK